MATRCSWASADCPTPCLSELTDRNELGIHTEMFSDGIIRLVKEGVITGKRKTLHQGKIVGSFAAGTQPLFDFLRQQSDDRNAPVGVHQRPARHFAARQYRGHQFGDRSRFDRTGGRRLDRRTTLQRHRRPCRFHARCGHGPRRQAGTGACPARPRPRTGFAAASCPSFNWGPAS